VARDRDLPSLPAALAHSIRFAYRAEPKLLLVSFALVVSSWIPDAFGALWLKLLANGAVAGDGRKVAWAAAGLAASGAAAWLLRIAGDRVHFLFRERATIAIEAHVARLQATVASIEHHERPEYLDRLQILRDQAFLLNHLYHSFMSTVGSVARLAITVALLATVHPALIALALFSVPTVVVASWRAGTERKVWEVVAADRRLDRHLLGLGLTSGPGKEIRLAGIADRLARLRWSVWERWSVKIEKNRTVSAAWAALTWGLFGAAYVGAIVATATVLGGSAGDVLLVLAAGANLSRYLGMTAAQADFLRWCVDAASRLVWLERYAEAHRLRADAAVPARIERGIRVEGVSFQYPGTDKWVLRDVSLDLPAGSVVAIVGENGAGKTTLVKLLCRFYEPTEGRITLDGADIARMPAEAWRERLAGAFQDFMRFELRARSTVGVGDLPRADEAPAVEAAVERGGAVDVVKRLPRGLDTQLGPTWREGVELSFGQWQKLALARGFMRDQPLLLVLDEPTAALDAETEHSLFERFAAASRSGTAAGRVTILVSHRFSTVRMADLIVVLDGSRVVEQGSHEELMARRGLYAELYGIQARAYA
jgi:ATP-binding cassette subfamily B protein